MGILDQKLFVDLVTRARAGGQINFMGDPYASGDAWIAALNACNRLAMFDMLPALRAINPKGEEQLDLLTAVEGNTAIIGGGSWRIKFAYSVVVYHEILDFGIPDDQVNDGREFLGCTRLDDTGVRSEITQALSQAAPLGLGGACCGTVMAAWTKVLVPKRQSPGGSLIANTAAAAHYMLARYHVCAAKLERYKMKLAVDQYEENKRKLIRQGDVNLKGVALTGNPPFPPDFSIRNWAYKGADDGESDRLRCNANKIRSLRPYVNGQYYPFEFPKGVEKILEDIEN